LKEIAPDREKAAFARKVSFTAMVTGRRIKVALSNALRGGPGRT
jgi:hypothetical protein